MKKLSRMKTYILEEMERSVRKILNNPPNNGLKLLLGSLMLLQGFKELKAASYLHREEVQNKWMCLVN